MERKKEKGGKRLQATAVLAALLCVIILFSAASASSEGIVRSVIRQRTEVMNDYFSGNLSYKEACQILRSTESGVLLEEDIEALTNFFATDIEEVCGYKINNIEINYEDEDIICAFVSMNWVVRGLDELYRGSGKKEITGNYSIIIEKEDSAYRLAQFS